LSNGWLSGKTPLDREVSHGHYPADELMFPATPNSRQFRRIVHVHVTLSADAST
jgi:hypothetical protein